MYRNIWAMSDQTTLSVGDFVERENGERGIILYVTPDHVGIGVFGDRQGALRETPWNLFTSNWDVRR